MALLNHFWRFDSDEEWVFEAYSVDAAGRLESTRGHIVPCQGKADSFLDLAPMPGNCLQSFVDRSVEILLAASSTHPGWYAIHIDRLAFEMKPGADHTLVYFPLAEFAQITGCHLYHLSAFSHVRRDDQQHTGRKETAHHVRSTTIRCTANQFITDAAWVPCESSCDSPREDNAFDVLRLKFILGHLLIRVGADAVPLFADGLAQPL